MRCVLLILSCAASFSFISGNPVKSVSSECGGYFFNVIGDHYVPNEKCFEGKWDIFETKLESFMVSYEKTSRKKRGTNPGDAIADIFGVGGKIAYSSYGDESIKTKCSYCSLAITLIKYLMEDGRTDDEMVDFAIELCQEMNIMTPDICYGFVKLNGYALMTVARNSILSSGEMCNILMRAECEEPDIKNQWKVQLPESKKPKVLDIKKPAENAPKLKVLLISDIHYDPYYVENTWAECQLPICCRADCGEPAPNATLSGKWGGWKCDTPKRTLDHLFEHLAKQHSDVDYIVWAGDIPPHDLWSFYKNDSISLLNEIVSMFSKYFPNTPCYPALGNHEAIPSNLFPTTEVADEFKLNWLYDEVAEKWSRWLPENTADFIRRGAFYSVLVRPGFRIISLNTNYCYSNNWWLLLNHTDPVGELLWLVENLQLAENNNEKVHIIGHVPPGRRDCIRVWQKNYYDIINRFENTVVAQFFGHIHYDEVELFYDNEDKDRIIGIAYIIPSVTTYPYLNPGFQIAYVDGDYEGTTRCVLERETYILDLEEANKCDDPEWTKCYSTKEAYNLESLVPSEWKSVMDRIATDDDFLELYHKHYWKNAPTRPPCGEDCRKVMMCNMRSCDQYGEYIVKKKTDEC